VTPDHLLALDSPTLIVGNHARADASLAVVATPAFVALGLTVADPTATNLRLARPMRRSGRKGTAADRLRA
jgi:hypothetical protein